MGNMSYCRFENTAADLRDCLSAIHRGETDDLSSYEINGLKNIMDMANELVEMEDDILELLNRLKEQV
jgi:predicted phage gp36 major capsid-like protein